MNRFAAVLHKAAPAFLIALNVVLALKLFTGEKSLVVYDDMVAKRDAAQARVTHIEERQREVSREIRLLKSDRPYLERVVRNDLNYVKEDEILYVFADPKP